MNAASNEIVADTVEFARPGPGERLRTARLAQNLELSKVAAQLHLADRLVEALERDAYEELPGRVFIRGYLRNYARIVGIAAEEILTQFEEICPDGECKELRRVSAGIRKEVRSSHGAVRLVSWLVAVIIVGLLFSWGRGYFSALTEALDGMGKPTPVEQGDDAPDLAGGGLALPPVSGQPVAIETAAPSVERTSAESAETLPLPAPVTEEPVMPTTAEGAVESGESAVPAEAATVAEQPAATAEPEPAVADEIVIAFSDNCWVDIRDSTRSFKIVGEMKAGTRRVLGGQAPYQMVLGNASAIELSVAGQVFDLAPYTTNNVARLRLNPDR